ncbi:MAG: tandem-95 repeat protein, partial [Thermoanaerobaculia bacterium]
MTPSRVVRVILAFLLLSVVPSFASAATTEFRVLFDVDNDDTTGCTVNGMDGVDQVLVTQVTDDDSSARVTRTHREVCTGSVLGGPIDIVTDGWDAGWNDTTKLLTLETRIPFTAFGSEDMPSGIHVGFDGTRNGSVHTSLANQDGSPIIIARPPSRGRGRRAVGFGDDRHIELDGQLADWGRIKPAVIGLASNGSPSLRLLRILAWPDTGDDHFYFAATAYLGSDYPYADDNMYLRNPGESLSITAPGVLDNDGIPSGAPLTAEKVSDPARGTVTLNADGSFTYSPTHPQLLRDDEFEYKAIGDGKESNVARVIIQVDQNDGPNAPQDDAYTTAEDTAKIVPGPGVLENDPHTDLLVASLFSPPSHGTVVINADGGFTYTPSPHFSGTDSFVYTAAKKQGAPEGIGGNATVTITVTPVNDAPVIEPDTFTIPENSPNNTVVGTPDAFDIDGDTLSFSIVGGNTGGAFSINSSTGQIRVANSSALNFETTPTFSLTVRVEDADDSDEATITINLTDTNEPPVLTAGGTLVYTENDPPSVIDGALTVTDTDSAQLTGATVVISANFASGQDVLAFTPVGAITGVFAGNTLTLSGNDTPANYQLALRGVTYQNTSDNPSVAARTITWTASDGTFTSAPVTSTVNVIAVNDEPSFAILADPPASDEDAGPQTVNGFASSISYGPEESGQDPLTFVLTPTGTTGDLAFSAGPAIDAAGNLTYTASADTNGTATFDVVLTDSGSNTPPNDNTSATLSFTITVDPVNDAPSFVEGADVVALDTDGLTTVTGWATSLSEGPANESAQLLDLIVGNDSPALFTVAPAIAPDGTLTFTPAPGQDGIATVTVQIHDDGGTANGGVDTSAAQT